MMTSMNPGLANKQQEIKIKVNSDLPKQIIEPKLNYNEPSLPNTNEKPNDIQSAMNMQTQIQTPNFVQDKSSLESIPDYKKEELFKKYDTLDSQQQFSDNINNIKNALNNDNNNINFTNNIDTNIYLKENINTQNINNAQINNANINNNSRKNDFNLNYDFNSFKRQQPNIKYELSEYKAYSPNQQQQPNTEIANDKPIISYEQNYMENNTQKFRPKTPMNLNTYNEQLNTPILNTNYQIKPQSQSNQKYYQKIQPSLDNNTSINISKNTNYQNRNLSLELNQIPLNNKNNNTFNSPYNNVFTNNTYTNNNYNNKFNSNIANGNNKTEAELLKYKSEISQLKTELQSLQNRNEILNNQLNEELKRNTQLQDLQNQKSDEENSILSDIAKCLQVSSFEEILPKLNKMVGYLNSNVSNDNKDNKLKDELISKLQQLYINLTGSNENKDDISIKTLWRWIKHLINTVKSLAIEKEKNIEMFQGIQQNDDYKNFCLELIDEFQLQSLDELKSFINDLLNKNNVNRKRVENLRKVLMNNQDDINQDLDLEQNDDNDYEQNYDQEQDNNDNINDNEQQYQQYQQANMNSNSYNLNQQPKYYY